MLSRVYLSDTGSFDAELALPTMALELLPPVLVGLVLAGIFAATMSTADSLILSCSSAITHDLLPHKVEKPLLLKLATIGITAAALGLALMNNQSVFNMVIMAWSGLASAFAPLLIVLALGARPGERLSIVAVVVGFVTALLWRMADLSSSVYEGLPGIFAGLLVFTLVLQFKKYSRVA
jgi:sodium/proline symporter